MIKSKSHSAALAEANRICNTNNDGILDDEELIARGRETGMLREGAALYSFIFRNQFTDSDKSVEKIREEIIKRGRFEGTACYIEHIVDTIWC
jgi:hypothetical protein